MNESELHCEKCGKYTVCETGKGFMIGEKFFCWFCSTELLKMKVEGKE